MSLNVFVRRFTSLRRRIQTSEQLLCRKLFSSSDDATSRGIEQNPFYDKYRFKLGELQTQEVRPPSLPEQRHISDSTPASSQSRQSLDSIPDISSMAHKTAEEIASTWSDYHSTLDCIHGTLPASSYTLMSALGSLCPHLIYPLPSDTEYRFMYQQYSMNVFNFTSLEEYKLLTQHAPIYFTLTYYTEFAAKKNIVLMAGKYDHEKLKVEEAQLLAQLLQLYYGQSKLVRTRLIRKFNFTPNLFDYHELIQQFKELDFV